MKQGLRIIELYPDRIVWTSEHNSLLSVIFFLLVIVKNMPSRIGIGKSLIIRYIQFFVLTNSETKNWTINPNGEILRWVLHSPEYIFGAHPIGTNSTLFGHLQRWASRVRSWRCLGLWLLLLGPQFTPSTFNIFTLHSEKFLGAGRVHHTWYPVADSSHLNVFWTVRILEREKEQRVIGWGEYIGVVWDCRLVLPRGTRLGTQNFLLYSWLFHGPEKVYSDSTKGFFD